MHTLGFWQHELEQLLRNSVEIIYICLYTKQHTPMRSIDFICRKSKKPKSKTKKLQQYIFPHYGLSSIIGRVSVVSTIGLLSVLLIKHVLVVDTPIDKTTELIGFAITIFSFNVLSEFQIVLDVVMERVFPIPSRIRLRLLFVLLLNIITIPAMHSILLSLLPDLPHIPRPVVYMAFAIGMAFVTMMSSALLFSRIMQQWLTTREHYEKMKQEKLKMDYNILQDSLNPHFLFNNLSVLKSLIIYEPNTAVKFTEDFTDVYRYVLQSKNKMLVKLQDELEFINAYLGLHKERLGDGLEVSLSIDKDCLYKEVPPLAVQLLVENAIKHNIASAETPLKIRIETQGTLLSVNNNLQLKNVSYSTHTGLGNLTKRYEMLTNRYIDVNESETEFVVKLPLL